MNSERRLLIAVVSVFVGLGVVSAQEPPKPLDGPGPNMIYRQHIGPGGPEQTMEFIATEMSFSGKPVKGAPYAAEVTNETTQTLADGNHIVRRTTGAFYRDSEGRTRREQTLPVIGPWSQSAPHQRIFISDPVASVSYELDPQAHTASKGLMGRDTMMITGGGDVLAMRRSGLQQAEVAAGKAHIVEQAIKVEAEGTFEMAVSQSNHPDVKSESLGKRMIEGVQAEGMRSTFTIPAAAIGNEQPIVSVSERWYSPELQTAILSKRSDPRSGETVYQLTNIRRGDQPSDLFEVPSDYTLRDNKLEMEKMFRAREKAEEAKKVQEVK